MLGNFKNSPAVVTLSEMASRYRTCGDIFIRHYLDKVESLGKAGGHSITVGESASRAVIVRCDKKPAIRIFHWLEDGVELTKAEILEDCPRDIEEQLGMYIDRLKEVVEKDKEARNKRLKYES